MTAISVGGRQCRDFALLVRIQIGYGHWRPVKDSHQPTLWPAAVIGAVSEQERLAWREQRDLPRQSRIIETGKALPWALIRIRR